MSPLGHITISRRGAGSPVIYIISGTDKKSKENFSHGYIFSPVSLMPPVVAVLDGQLLTLRLLDGDIRGGADIGCGCERGAGSITGADFIPLQLEWYDLVFRLPDRDTPVIKALISYISKNEFKQDLSLMGGYDLSQTGNYVEF